MDIILFRHGIAEDVSFDGSDDARQLTPEGIERTTQAARGLAFIIEQPTLILTSPKTRARQTADLVAKAFHGPQPVVDDIIASDSATRIAQALLKRQTPRLVVVGHEPTLSHVAELLCTGSQSLDLFTLKKAGAIALELPDSQRASAIPGRLLWTIPPAILRNIGR